MLLLLSIEVASVCVVVVVTAVVIVVVSAAAVAAAAANDDYGNYVVVAIVPIVFFFARIAVLQAQYMANTLHASLVPRGRRCSTLQSREGRGGLHDSSD